MNDHFKQTILNATGASALTEAEVIQNLWSGYGKILRVTLEYNQEEGMAPRAISHVEPRACPAQPRNVIVKHVHWPDATNHPRGWNTDRSHERKVKSYQVETVWYRDYASQCDDTCRIPACYALETHGDEVFMVLEYLDAAGFDGRRSHVSNAELTACLSWLAHFHATFMNVNPAGLWKTGTYWHLETRPDELAELDDATLKAAAPAIDRRLKDSPFQTFVHGDAKLANFCFAQDGRVAAVDFQYVGGGCGMKDVAYFISSCLSESECEQRENELLDFYFNTLKTALEKRRRRIDFPALEKDWRALYPVAWTDFFRFLQGWSPGHWKIHGYSERLARNVLETL